MNINRNKKITVPLTCEPISKLFSLSLVTQISSHNNANNNFPAHVGVVTRANALNSLCNCRDHFQYVLTVFSTVISLSNTHINTHINTYINIHTHSYANAPLNKTSHPISMALSVLVYLSY